MAIPSHVRSFASVENRQIAKVNGKDFDKKVHYLHVRPADQSDIVIIACHADKKDPDIVDTASFIALNVRNAASLALLIEDVLVHDLNFDFDKYRKTFLSNLEKKVQANEPAT